MSGFQTFPLAAKLFFFFFSKIPKLQTIKKLKSRSGVKAGAMAL